MSQIQNKAMLATLNCSQWSARKLDKKVSKEIEQTHQAKDAGRFNKLLISGEALKPIANLVGKIRAYHDNVTLPWMDDGKRILPAKLYLDYTQQMRAMRDEFNRLVSEFVQDYPTMIKEARLRLGTMYDPNEYPSPDVIRGKFDMTIRFEPVPDAADFRVDISDDDVKAIRADITKNIASQQQVALQHCWTRLREVVSKIEERLSDPEAIFRDSLIDNARELVKVLPALNLLGDPELEAARADVEHRLCMTSPQRLRTDKAVRAQTAQAARDILDRMQKYAAAA